SDLEEAAHRPTQRHGKLRHTFEAAVASIGDFDPPRVDVGLVALDHSAQGVVVANVAEHLLHDEAGPQATHDGTAAHSATVRHTGWGPPSSSLTPCQYSRLKMPLSARRAAPCAPSLSPSSAATRSAPTDT